MDNVTHGLWGLGIYGAWVASQPHVTHSPLTTTVFLASVLGSEAPDADYIIKLTRGNAAYLKDHRGVSHSLPMLLIWSLVISTGLSLWRPGHFWLLFGMALIGVVIHVLVDILTPYGTQAFWPLSKRKPRLDILFTIDPVFILLGVAGLIFSARYSTGWVVGGCFTVALLYTAVRFGVHAAIRARLRRRYPQATRISVLPQLVPWWWAYVIESAEAIEGGALRMRRGLRPELSWKKPVDGPPPLIAWTITESPLGRLFAGFARHLIWQVKQDGALRRVYLADATYRFGNWLPFSVCVSVVQGEAGEWVVGAESVRGQSVDFAELGRDLSTSMVDRVRPKIPTQNP